MDQESRASESMQQFAPLWMQAEPSVSAYVFAVLGHPAGIDEQNRRGIEPPRKDPPGKPELVSVILASDKRTLILKLGAGSPLDKIRVIVDDPKPNWSNPSK